VQAGTAAEESKNPDIMWKFQNSWSLLKGDSTEQGVPLASVTQPRSSRRRIFTLSRLSETMLTLSCSASRISKGDIGIFFAPMRHGNIAPRSVEDGTNLALCLASWQYIS
jgi:hypothetical protein